MSNVIKNEKPREFHDAISRDYIYLKRKGGGNSSLMGGGNFSLAFG